MKITVLDYQPTNPGDLSWDKLNSLGELSLYPKSESKKEIIERLKGSEIALINKTSLDKEVLQACPELKLICVMATGYNVVDIEQAQKQGIKVCNVPAYSTEMVAQHTLALLLEICHHVYQHSDHAKKQWSESEYFSFWDYPLIELNDKTIGIIGFGSIGQRFAKICLSLGMKVLTLNNHSHNSDLDFEAVSLDELLKRSDIISLHCPLTKENTKLINEETIKKMKDNVIILNTARGQLIDEEALAKALINKKVLAAGVDVLSSEPPRKDNPLLSVENCFITPHIAWSSKECRERILEVTYQNIIGYLNKEYINVVS